MTLGASATYAGTEKVAVYWTAAGVNYYRYDCAITSGTGTSFTVSSGTGTALPSGGQAVLVATNRTSPTACTSPATTSSSSWRRRRSPGWSSGSTPRPAGPPLLPAGVQFLRRLALGGRRRRPALRLDRQRRRHRAALWNFSATAAVMQVGANLA